jgi:biopolymer transport protein ExbD
MKLSRRTRSGAEVPTASMSDIAFLLLLFFMVTTVFSAAKALQITVPKAASTERIKIRRFTISVWVDREGRLLVDDNFVDQDGTADKHAKIGAFSDVVASKYFESPESSAMAVILLRVDQNARYGLISDLIEALREINALRITFATKQEDFGQ